MRRHRQRDRRDRRAPAPRCRCSSRRPTSPSRRTLPGTGCPSGRGRRASAGESGGNACASSHSITWGRISASANSRTVLRSSACSSVGRKSIVSRLYHGVMLGNAHPFAAGSSHRCSSTGSAARRRRSPPRPTSPRSSASTPPRPTARLKGFGVGLRPPHRRLRVRVRPRQRGPDRRLAVAAHLHVQRPGADAGSDRRDAVLRHGRRRRLPRDAERASRRRTSGSTSAAA